MVQKATQAAYLDMVSFQSQSSKVSGSSDKKSSFSEALDRELTQDQQPVENDRTDKTEEQPKVESEKPEEAAQPETEEATNDKAQEEQPQQEKDVESSAAAQLMAQLQIQQSAQAQQVTEAPAEVVAETESHQVVSTLAAAVTEEQNAQTQQVASGDVQAVIGEEGSELVQQLQKGDVAVVAQQEGDVQQSQTVMQAAESTGQQMQQNSQGEQHSQEQQPEIKAAAGMADAISQIAQGQAQQIVSAAQQPVQTQTVNMSQPQQGMQNLANTMAENIKQGVNEFEIWLEPANLGKIGVKVAYEGGRAMISIMCMSDKAMEIIAQNSKTLGAIIQQNTGTNTIVVVDQPERQDYLQQESQKQQREDQQQEDQQENRGSNEEDAETQSFLQQLRLGLK